MKQPLILLMCLWIVMLPSCSILEPQVQELTEAEEALTQAQIELGNVKAELADARNATAAEIEELRTAVEMRETLLAEAAERAEAARVALEQRSVELAEALGGNNPIIRPIAGLGALALAAYARTRSVASAA